MKTTVKLLASAVALCIVPVTYAITPEQAAANLAGAQQFSHLADKAYSTAMYNERVTSLALSNTAYQYGNSSAMTQKAVLSHDAALAAVAQARLDARAGRVQVNAALDAFRNGSIAPVAVPQAIPQKLTAASIPQPTQTPVAVPQAIPQKLAAASVPQPTQTPVAVPQAIPQKLTATAITQTIKTPGTIVQNVPTKKPVLTTAPQHLATQIVITKPQPTTLTAGLPANAVIHPQVPYTSSVTIVDQTPPKTTAPVTVSSTDNTAKRTATSVTTTNPTTGQTTGATYNVTAISQVNSFYVSQTNSRQVADNSQRIDNNSQRIQSNSQRIDSNSRSIERNAKEIDDTRDDLKRGLNNAAAMSSLHYHSDNAWALSTGTANGDGAALAGGIQKGLTRHVAVNMQASTSFDSGWMAGAGISGDF